MAKYQRVQVGKIDLDTCGACFLLGVTREDKVEVLRGGQATEEDLVNPEILCIEVGGSDRVLEGNFDHHGPGSELRSATRQTWETVPCRECGGSFLDVDPHFIAFGPILGTTCESGLNRVRSRLVDYIDRLDVDGPQSLGRRQKKGLFPTLSDVFTGMLLVTREPVEQLHRGVEILREVVDHSIDPYGRMPIEKIKEWSTFSNAKTEHNRLAKEMVGKAKRNITASGLRMASVESRFIGAIGELYGTGIKVVVVLNPDYEGVRKFTIAGNDIRIDVILPELNAREQGWGGPRTGTILGSPRGKDSILSLEEVAEIVRRYL